MKGIDFSNAKLSKKTYGGANGQKFQIIFNGEPYMLKFPAKAKLNKELSYANSCISEYLGSHIFNLVGIPAQETILGTFKKNGKERIVVACKDFIPEPGVVIQDFISIKNTVVDSEGEGSGTELSDVLFAIDNQPQYDPMKLRKFFWDMFIVDALIGNWDRHNGNWGLLYDERTDKVLGISPVFDCGSSLFPQADEKIMKAVLNNKEDRDYRVFEIPLSALRVNRQRIKYYNFISSLKNDDCNEALLRIASRINIEKINELIDDTPYIGDLQKQFYKTMIKERKEHIIDRPFEKLLRKKNPKLSLDSSLANNPSPEKSRKNTGKSRQ